jgi:heptosyltransferase-2
MGRRRAKAVRFPESPDFLVIETGLVGELLVITPALRAIRKAYPSARITVMARPGSAPVLVGNPAVDRLLPLSKRERGGTLGVMRLASWIRAKNFDAVFVFHTSFRSALIAAMGAVPVRAGLSCEGRGFLLTHRVRRDRSAYEVDEHLAVVELLGVDPDGRELEIFLTEEERVEAQELLESVPAVGPRVGIHPGASRDIRRWPAKRFAELGARLARERGAVPVFLFGPDEQDLAGAVSGWFVDQGLPAPAIIFPGTVRILGALFEEMAAVVTNNTGPMHVAAAVVAAGAFIHGPTPVRRWHPPGDQFAEVFARDAECRPCDSPRCRLDRTICMEGVGVDQVYEAVTAVMDRVVGVVSGGGTSGSSRSGQHGAAKTADATSPGAVDR